MCIENNIKMTPLSTDHTRIFCYLLDLKELKNGTVTEFSSYFCAHYLTCYKGNFTIGTPTGGTMLCPNYVSFIPYAVTNHIVVGTYLGGWSIFKSFVMPPVSPAEWHKCVYIYTVIYIHTDIAAWAETWGTEIWYCNSHAVTLILEWGRITCWTREQ